MFLSIASKALFFLGSKKRSSSTIYVYNSYYLLGSEDIAVNEASTVFALMAFIVT